MNSELTINLLQGNLAEIFRLRVKNGDAVLLTHGELTGRLDKARKTHCWKALATWNIYTMAGDAAEAGACEILKRRHSWGAQVGTFNPFVPIILHR